jgi:hypothetical protein
MIFGARKTKLPFKPHHQVPVVTFVFKHVHRNIGRTELGEHGGQNTGESPLMSTSTQFGFKPISHIVTQTNRMLLEWVVQNKREPAYISQWLEPTAVKPSGYTLEEYCYLVSCPQTST